MYEDPKSKISQLEHILDAREDRVTRRIKRHELQPRVNNVKTDWEDSAFPPPLEDEILDSKDKKSSLPWKFLVFSALFFVLASGFVAYKFLVGVNLVSSENIDITVKAPTSVLGGEIMPMELEIKNNNNVTLIGSDLNITFPVGAKDATNSSLSAKRVQDFIGNILPGQSIKKNYAVALYGAENEKKDINIVLEYRINDSSSLFKKTKIVSVVIGSAPVSINVTGPKEINTNQALNFSVEIASNSSTVIKNLLLKVTYPFGFTFTSASPKTVNKNNYWLIGDLEPGAKRTITFSGILDGQEGEERSFNFEAGLQAKADSAVIDVPLFSTFSLITIRRPFVGLDIFLDESSADEYVTSAGSNINASIRWRNNLPYKVYDVSLAVKLSGSAFDRQSVEVDDGLYKSIDNTIIFNKATDRSLAAIEPGGEGISTFSFKSFDLKGISALGLSNPTIDLVAVINGRRVDYAEGPENVTFTDARKIKITAEPQLFAKALYYTGPLKNTGPVPPRAEKETTYTITWSVTNPLNNMSGVKVSAFLPADVRWLGTISPVQEKVDYDDNSRQIVWTVGNVSAGAGIISPAKEVSFQIAILPGLDQIGQTPDLISESSLSARDAFTLTSASDTFNSLDTKLNSDPYFRTGDDVILK